MSRPRSPAAPGSTPSASITTGSAARGPDDPGRAAPARAPWTRSSPGPRSSSRSTSAGPTSPWSRNWDGLSGEVLMEQRYAPGFEAALARSLAPFLRDPSSPAPRRRAPSPRRLPPRGRPRPGRRHGPAARGPCEGWGWARSSSARCASTSPAPTRCPGGRSTSGSRCRPTASWAPRTSCTPPRCARGCRSRCPRTSRGSSTTTPPSRPGPPTPPAPTPCRRTPSRASCRLGTTPPAAASTRTSPGVPTRPRSRSWLRALSRGRLARSYRREVMVNAWNEWAERAAMEPSEQWGRALARGPCGVARGVLALRWPASSCTSARTRRGSTAVQEAFASQPRAPAPARNRLSGGEDRVCGASRARRAVEPRPAALRAPRRGPRPPGAPWRRRHAGEPGVLVLSSEELSRIHGVGRVDYRFVRDALGGFERVDVLCLLRDQLSFPAVVLPRERQAGPAQGSPEGPPFRPGLTSSPAP